MKRVIRLSTDALLLGVIIVAIFIIAGEFTIYPLFRLLGAGKIDRIYRALKLSYFFSIIWGVCIFLIFLFTGKYLGALFNKDPVVIKTVTLYLNYIAISYGLQGFIYLSSSALNALNKPLHTMALSATRMFILYVPFALLGSKLMGLRGIFIGASLSNIGAGLLSLLLVYKMLGKLKKKILKWSFV